MNTVTACIENSMAYFWISEGILFVKYKAGTFLGLDNARELTAERLRLQREKPYPVFVDMRKVKNIDRAARCYFAREGSILISAMAIYTPSPQTKAIADFYLLTNIPVVPTQLFENKHSAINYLKSFLQPGY
ncbi:DUF7793 family protein [Sinomicrobium oceani]|uniref:DUF7793 family protein n=1 Tax=Sinomicrobium oceani TaxID=1150368 RepID=UPI00227B0FCB|nr:hypothetical protein [Sinomicrobium oceani]